MWLEEPREDDDCGKDRCDNAPLVVQHFIKLGADLDTVANDGSTLAHAMLTGSDSVGGEASVECLRLLLAKCTDKEILKKPRASVRTQHGQFPCDSAEKKSPFSRQEMC